ncbi:(Fe-S)-binding protein [Desulfosporosinus sp. SB140]|uniref:(Fe-S)-binding protein n=1 Tax=Desulfosporosinus paludis TaxID=3115649 RepID=UPI00388FF1E4
MNFAEEAARCQRCGMCQPVCPLYQAEKQEPYVARGKMQLVSVIEAGLQTISPAAKTTFYNCLDCRACMEICPSKVNVKTLVKGMRNKIFKEQGDNIIMTIALEHLTPYPERLELARKSLKAYQTLGLPSLVRTIPLFRQREKLLPPVPPKSFRESLRQRVMKKGSKGRVAYFISCTTDILYPQVGEAVIEVLEACGFEVYPMLDGTCCGVPQTGYGHKERAKEMALRNMQAVPEDIEFVVNDCATCGSALQEYDELFEGTEHAEQAKQFSEKMIDISAFLVQHAQIPAGEKLKLRVTYHEPCHLGRAQNIKEEPRRLIKQSVTEFTEMADPGRCCGGAGTFGITHFELSQKILKRKVAEIEETKAEAVVTGCPACRMQIAFGLDSYYKKMPVYHPVELIANYIRKHKEFSVLMKNQLSKS